MTATVLTPAPPARAVRRELGIVWWRELILLVGFYLIYTLARNQFGSAAVSPQVALDNARLMIDIEAALGLYFEPDLQAWFIDNVHFMRFWNIFYGVPHFVVTWGALIWLFVRFPADYPRLRTIGLGTTGLALVGFSLLPLMPPRLLANCGDLGACLADTGYVDSMAEIGGLWSYDSGTIEQLSNQYAAMPSLHFAWAVWSFVVLYPRIRNPLGRALVALYPVATLFAIVVTANHYWIDAVGGVAVLAGGYGIAGIVGRLRPADDATSDARVVGSAQD